jgi:hypothetical protein
VTDTLAAAETASFCSGVCGRFAQQAKRSRSNQGFKVAFGRHQKLCIFDEEADLHIAIERVVSEIGAGDQRKVVDNCNLGVEFPWTAR